MYAFKCAYSFKSSDIECSVLDFHTKKLFENIYYTMKLL